MGFISLNYPKPYISLVSINSMNNLLPLMNSNNQSDLLIRDIPFQENIFKGFELGIPLNIFTFLYTYLHYNQNIIDINILVLNFLIGYFTYGRDRYVDALDFKKKEYKTEKKELYNLIYKSKEIYNICFFLSFMEICHILLSDHELIQMLPFIIILFQTTFYKNIKKLIGVFKSTYISVMWSLAVLILPCVLHDNDYSILYYPQDYLPFALTLIASSNLADCKDIEEDKINGIETFPVKYGLYTTNIMNNILLLLSSLILFYNHWEDNSIITGILELQNIGISASSFLLLKNIN